MQLHLRSPKSKVQMSDHLIDYALSIVNYVDTKKKTIFFFKKKSNMRVFSSGLILTSVLILYRPFSLVPYFHSLWLYFEIKVKNHGSHIFFSKLPSTFHPYQASFSTTFTSIQLKSLSPLSHPLKSNTT